MPSVTPRSSPPPGETLARMSRTLFRGMPAAASLEALIADAQREWLACHGRAARRVRCALVLSFWRATLAEAGRLLLLPDRHVIRLAVEYVALSFAFGLGMQLLLHADAPATVLIHNVTQLFVILSGPAASLFQPSNVARRLPPTTPRGWWPFGQFLILCLTALAIWLVLTDGSFAWFLAAIGYASVGVVISSLTNFRAATRPER